MAYQSFLSSCRIKMHTTASYLAIFSVFLVPGSFLSIQDAEQFLTHYGYLPNITATTSDDTNSSSSLFDQQQVIRDAIRQFQTIHNLTADGELNNETLDYMARPRCGLPDNLEIREPWSMTDLTWHFFRANDDQNRAASKAFALWSRYSNLRFRRKLSSDANILISFQSRLRHNHLGEDQRECAPFSPEAVAHGYYPYKGVTQSEIHLNTAYNWSTDRATEGDEQKESIYKILVHEIGHVLGLEHSMDRKSIMFANYEREAPYDSLTTEEIEALEKLYGKKQSPKPTTAPHPNPTPAPTHTSETQTHTPNPNYEPRVYTPTRSFTPNPNSEPRVYTQTHSLDPNPNYKTQTLIPTPGLQHPALPPDLCQLQEVNKFVIINGRMYILYKTYMWPVNFEEKQYEAPIPIRAWFKFLPENFEEISAVYQEPSGDIVAIVQDKLYVIDSSSLLPKDNYPMPLNNVIPYTNSVHSMFNSYTGRTYVLYDSNHYAELSFCDNWFRPKKRERLENEFPGIPAKIDAVFRYTNGHLYFFKGQTVYEYSEFSKKVIRALPFNLGLFNIECPTESILFQLKGLLSKLNVLLDSNLNKTCSI